MKTIVLGPHVVWSGEAVIKRASARERFLYQHLLAEQVAPTLLRSSRRRLWIAHLPGDHPDFGDERQAEAAFRWLGALHRRYAGLNLPRLRRRPPGMLWPAPARRIARTLGDAGVEKAKASALGEALAGEPRTLVHGDFHRWNLVVTESGLRAIDWEHGACAHPIWDLLLLDERASVALRAYHEAGPLAFMAYALFTQLHTAARLFVALERASLARRRAAQAEPGPAEVLLAHARRDEEQAGQLLLRLGSGLRPAEAPGQPG